MAGAGALAVSTRTSKMAHPHNAFDARTVDQRGYTCPWAGLLATWWPVSERGCPRDCFKEEEVEDSNLLKNEPQSCHGIISAVFSELCSSRGQPQFNSMENKTLLLDRESDKNFEAVFSPLHPPVGFWRYINISLLGP